MIRSFVRNVLTIRCLVLRRWSHLVIFSWWRSYNTAVFLQRGVPSPHLSWQEVRVHQSPTHSDCWSLTLSEYLFQATGVWCCSNSKTIRVARPLLSISAMDVWSDLWISTPFQMSKTTLWWNRMLGEHNVSIRSWTAGRTNRLTWSVLLRHSGFRFLSSASTSIFLSLH